MWSGLKDVLDSDSEAGLPVNLKDELNRYVD
jgi:hypothetical protein